jgi:serine/threonine protein kinase
VRKIEDASRNFGSVCLMRDLAHGTLVAMKQMPMSWIQTSHEAFNLAHPHESEQPWNDIGCNAFLDSVGYPYCAKLIGVFRDTDMTSVVTEFAAGGDMFRWASKIVEEPGLLREARVKPLAKQIGRGIQYLHELSIVHGDLSLENILLTPAADSDAGAHIKIIDFGAAVTGRFQKGRVTGKEQYQAPEMFDEEIQYDGFLSDAFSFGVAMYCVCLHDYPWKFTSGNGDKCFQFVKSRGFAAFVGKKKLRESTTKVGDVLSLELRELMEGLLYFDPASRLTLGESVYGSSRRSIWDLAWTQ